MWWQNALVTYARRFEDQPPGLRIQGGVSNPVVLGVGSHGVVFACVNPKYVMKLTSDCSEGYFATTFMEQKRKSAGIASYKQIAVLRRTERGSSFAMWREALVAPALINKQWFERTYGLVQTTDALRLVLAYGQISLSFRRLYEKNKSTLRGDIGEQMKHLAPRVSDSSYEFLADMLKWSTNLVSGSKTKVPLAKEARLPASQSLLGIRAKMDTNLQMAMLFNAMLAGAKAMRETSTILVDVGHALEDQVRSGILLMDVFPRNIGPVKRAGRVVNVVFDPGHAFFLDDQYDATLMALPSC